MREMKTASVVSAMLHAAVLGWALVSFSTASLEATPPESLPVDLVSAEDFSKLTKGSKDAPKPAEQKPLVEKINPQLLATPGIGADVAGQLLVTAGQNTNRIRSEAAFAMLCGAAPLPASSGKTTRHRLNRGGDRHANRALWRIVITRMATDPRTRAYVTRRTAEGLSKTEIIRCLKRYIAREVHALLTANNLDEP